MKWDAILEQIIHIVMILLQTNNFFKHNDYIYYELNMAIAHEKLHKLACMTEVYDNFYSSMQKQKHQAVNNTI